MAKAHGIGCQICTTSWGIAAEGFSRKSSRVAETVSGIHRSKGKDFGESDRAGQNLGEKRDHCGVAPEADKVGHLAASGRSDLGITIHRRFPASLPRDREFGSSPFNE
jgi:hypothetical protein